MRRFAFIVFGLGLALCRAEAVSAAVFRVMPVKVELSSATPSTLVTLGNDSDRELRFQVSAFVWEQAPDGTMQLAPTRDIVFFPMMLTLGPGEERKLRVGSTAPVGSVEKSYRIFVEELPPAPGTETQSGAFQVRVLTKVGIPVFIEPARPQPAAEVEVQEIALDRVRFRVRNTGNAHFTLQNVHIQGLGPSGERVIDRQADGWYVLAGGTREFEQAISPEECGRLKTVAIEAKTELGSVTASQEVPLFACAPHGSREVASKTE